MYGTTTAWLTYASARGEPVSGTYTQPQLDAALTRASDYVKYRYMNRISATAVLPAGLPEEAAYEIASIEVKDPGFFKRTYTPHQTKVITQADGVNWAIVPGRKDQASIPVLSLVEDMFSVYVTEEGPARGGLWSLNV